MINIAAEKNFENKIKSFLKEQNCWFIKYWSNGQFTKDGVPDLLICCNGFFIGAEVKATNGKPSELQLYNLDLLEKTGGIGFIVIPTDGISKVKKYIAKNCPNYIHIKVIDFDQFKKLILFLKGYEPIGNDLVY